MKNLLQITACTFLLLLSINSNAQTVVYADSVIAFSSEYSSNNWSAQKIKGAPNVYPLCEDNPQSWAPTSGSGAHNWISLYYATAIKVDTVKIYETYNHGAIDTVYLRNKATQAWNVVYTNTSAYNETCNILKIGMPQTSYLVDAVKFSLNLTVSFQEYDAVALTNKNITTSIRETKNVSNIFTIYPNPTKGDIAIKLNNLSGSDYLKIYSLIGNVVYEQKLEKYNETIDTKLSKGIYFVEVSNGLNEKSTSKLIVE